MKLLLPRLLTYPQSPNRVHNTTNNVSPTSPTGGSPLPVVFGNHGVRTASSRIASTFYVDLQASFFGTSRRGHFNSALATAALTGLAGTHEFPLITVAAGTALGELLSRRRDGGRRDSERVGLIESAPLSEQNTSRSDADDPRQRDEAKESDLGLSASSPHVGSPQASEVDAQHDWVLVTRAAGYSTGTMGASHSSVDTIRPSLQTVAPSEGLLDGKPLGPVHRNISKPRCEQLGLLRKDYAYESSGKLTDQPNHNVPPAQLSLRSSPSVSSFVTAQTHLSHQPSMASIRRKRYGSIPRSESPIPAFQHWQSSPQSRGPLVLRVPTTMDLRHRSNNDPRRIALDQRSQTLNIPEEASDLTPTAAHRTTRRLLIIRSNYESGTRRTGTMFSAKTLLGVDNDTALLWEAFEERGYEVELQNSNDYDREDVLHCVADFVSDARLGDIRAIAFIGHGYSAPDGTVMLIPPYCPTTGDAIPRDDWENNIRTHSKPGSIVFSIMAHCFSGDIMRQEHDCRTWVTQEDVSPISSQSTPTDKSTFITFTSSNKDQFSFESTVERRVEAGAQDHFLYALAMTIKAAEVRTWGSFFSTFKSNFDRARSTASWADGYDSDSTMHEDLPTPLASRRANVWRMANLQDPRFSASEVLDYSRVFLVPVPVVSTQG